MFTVIFTKINADVLVYVCACACNCVCVIYIYFLSFVTTITVLTRASFFFMTFNYGGKREKDVGFTCRCHMNNIMPDCIFYDCIFKMITCLCVSLFVFLLIFGLFLQGVATTVFPRLEEMDTVFCHYRTNGHGKTLV